MQAQLSNKPVKQQEEASNLQWLSSMSESVIESVKSVAAPGFNSSVSLFGSATRVCYWLGTQAWSSFFGSTPDAGTSKEAKEFLDNWEKLRQAAPHLDRLGAAYAEQTLKLERLNPGDANYQETKNQHHELLSHLQGHLNANSPELIKMLQQSENLIKAETARLKTEGFSEQEIEKKLESLTDARKDLEQYRDQAIQAVRQAKEDLMKFHDKIISDIEQEGQLSRELASSKGICESEELKESREKLKHHCHDGVCEINDTLSRVEQRLERMDPAGARKEIKLANEQSEQFFNGLESTHETHVHVRNDFYASNGISKAEINQTFEQIDASFRNTVKEFSRYMSNTFDALDDAVQKIYKSTETLKEESVSFLRMYNAAIYGTGGSMLSLGLFGGPYALSALSYIEEQMRLEKLSRKMQFLAPPATAQEHEEYKKML